MPESSRQTRKRALNPIKQLVSTEAINTKRLSFCNGSNVNTPPEQGDERTHGDRQAAGGLGNQMFQYAAGKALSLKHGTSLKLDLEFLKDRAPNATHVLREFGLDVFSMQTEVATREEIEELRCEAKWNPKLGNGISNRVRRWLQRSACLNEPDFRFFSSFFLLPRRTYLNGYWQSPKYFDQYESEIRYDFQFRYPVLEKSQRLLERITSANSVCLHVRRTDYLSPSARILGVCEMTYYAKAMSVLRERVAAPELFVFSDDPDWCARQFVTSDVTIVDSTHNGLKSSNHLQLMAKCKHFILCNSSFGWWAGWLSQNPGKVVLVPEPWFTDDRIDTSDLFCPEWIRINRWGRM
jgi:hypothetical protein